MKKLIMGSLLLLFFAVACQDDDLETVVDDSDDDSEETVNSEFFSTSISEAMEANQASHEADDDNSWDEEGATIIQLNETAIDVDGDGVLLDGTTATISTAGTYIVKGTLLDGQLAVDTEDEESVKIIFEEASITNSTNAPFNVISAEKVIVFIPEATESTFTDAADYIYASADEDEPNAAFFSKADLSIYSAGTLTINANYNDGLSSKDGLLIEGGSYSITSADDGVRGKDYLIVREATFTIESVGDAFKSDNDDDDDRGYMLIESGDFHITTTEGDGFQAETDLLVAEGNFDITTGGGSSYYDEDVSAKALKAGVNNIVEAGVFTINSADDAIHCDGNLVIHDGDFTIATGDDGIHADEELTINGGVIEITESYEGLESNTLTINGGDINLVASDDGINAAGGNDSSEGRPGDSFGSGGDSYMYFQGGYIVVNAGGDGIDANGSIVMSSGTLIINGPQSGANGPIDYDGSFEISGGTLIAVGTSNMAQAPGNSSSQNAVLVYLSQQSAGTPFVIQNSEGENIVAFESAKAFESVVFSSPNLEDDVEYNIYTGGVISGTAQDGLYSEVDDYTGGSLLEGFTTSSVITTVNR
ncbi:carbohydrate-binding domain-containing protein [Fulvivirga maritima]|uniref:carbohydrate-binding domain-containing protein n=1 Tax=Fulvivirga maritima TaxID=2904247 RepID=UPI001F3A2BD5|nr:carbohydrate-binding domain-containing protein [Fulvivirga maritima]UII25855.1 carbohydrate-binding domain-containing protein [Fulvivirga maritima]